MTNIYRAFVLSKDGDTVGAAIQHRNMSMLGDGNVTIRVAWSSINYKDGLATLSKGGIVRDYPRVPGIDLSGIVTDSSDARFKEGERVLVTGFGAGNTEGPTRGVMVTVPSGSEGVYTGVSVNGVEGGNDFDGEGITEFGRFFPLQLLESASRLEPKGA